MYTANSAGLVLYVALTACLLAGHEARTLPRHHHSHKRLKHARIRAIQEDLLRKLQLTSIPQPYKGAPNASRVADERRVMQMYRDSIEELEHQPSHSLFDSNEYLAKEFHSFVDTGRYPDGVDHDIWETSLENHIRFYIPFDIPQPMDPVREKVTHSATLKVMTVVDHPEVVIPRDGSVDRTYRINLYQLLEPATSTSNVHKRLVDSVLVSLDSRTTWVSFNVKSAVHTWLENPSLNYGFEISGEDELMRRVMRVMTFRTVTGDHDNARDGSLSSAGHRVLPSLHVYTQTRIILDPTRHRRSHERNGETEDCTQGDGETRCCRYPLTISFEDIGWDWVFHPKQFDAYFCDGSCPFRHKSAHEFTDIQSFINMVNPRAAPSPCCSATKLQPLTLVHYNEDGVLTITTLNDMIVEQCMCA